MAARAWGGRARFRAKVRVRVRSRVRVRARARVRIRVRVRVGVRARLLEESEEHGERVAVHRVDAAQVEQREEEARAHLG